MKMMKGFVTAVIMAALAVSIAGARGPYTPETLPEYFVRAAEQGDIRLMANTMTDDAAALLILYADANRVKNIFSKKGGIVKTEQVSNDGNNAITKVTFRDGSVEQFKIVKGRYEWLIASQIVKRN